MLVKQEKRNVDVENKRPECTPFFPLFVDLWQKKIVIVGAGTIALRRMRSLLPFAPELWIVAPEITANRPSIPETVHLLKQKYEPSVCQGAFLVLAATNDAWVNTQIWEECKEKHILVNVCSDRDLCDFQLPGIASRGDLVIGINAGGQDHRLAKTWTDKIKKEVTEDGFNNQTKTSSDISKA